MFDKQTDQTVYVYVLCHSLDSLYIGILEEGRYYYGNNRKQGKYPYEKRQLQEEIPKMQLVEDEDRVTWRANLAKATGFTGISALHRLNGLL